MDKHRKNVLVSSGIIGASIIIAAAFLAWFSASASGFADKIGGYRKVVREEAQLIASIAQMRDIEPQIARYEARLAAFLPKEEQLLNFGQWIDTLEADNRVLVQYKFQSITSPATDVTPGTMGLALTILGEPRGIDGFFSALKSPTRKYIVQLVSYNATEQRAGQYEVTASGQVYFRK